MNIQKIEQGDREREAKSVRKREKGDSEARSRKLES